MRLGIVRCEGLGCDSEERTEDPLPPGWLELTIQTTRGRSSLRIYQLCAKCAVALSLLCTLPPSYP